MRFSHALEVQAGSCVFFMQLRGDGESVLNQVDELEKSLVLPRPSQMQPMSATQNWHPDWQTQRIARGAQNQAEARSIARDRRPIHAKNQYNSKQKVTYPHRHLLPAPHNTFRARGGRRLLSLTAHHIFVSVLTNHDSTTAPSSKCRRSIASPRQSTKTNS
jgi:hypothetical protein